MAFGLGQGTSIRGTQGGLTDINRLVVRHETLEWSVFRGEGQETHYTPAVAMDEYGRYTPLPTRPGALTLTAFFRSARRRWAHAHPLSARPRSTCSAPCSNFSSTATNARHGS